MHIGYIFASYRFDNFMKCHETFFFMILVRFFFYWALLLVLFYQVRFDKEAAEGSARRAFDHIN